MKDLDKSFQRVYDRCMKLNPNRVTQVRSELFLSKEDLGKKAGVSGATIGAWERGVQQPYPKHIRALGRATRRKASWFCEDDEPTPEGEVT